MKLPLAKHCEKIKKFPLRGCLWAVFLSKNPNLLTFFVDPEANFAAPKKTKNPVTIEITGFFLVGVARLELAASWSRTMRATICATPRSSFFIIMITHTVVKYQFSFLQRNMRNLSILVFGRNVSFCYFHLDSIPESHYNKTTAVSPVLQTLLTTSLETVHCCQSPFFFLSMLRKYKNAATFVAAFLWWTIQDSNL